jgi:hypothetical protein
VKSACIGTLVRELCGGERKNDTPKPGRRGIARKDDEFPNASHLREERERDAATEPRAAMPTKNEEFAKAKIARGRHEGKGRLTYEREAYGCSICEGYKRYGATPFPWTVKGLGFVLPFFPLEL